MPLPEVLTKKYGPLPGYAYVAGGAAVLGVYVWRKRASSSAATATDTTAADTTAADTTAADTTGVDSSGLDSGAGGYGGGYGGGGPVDGGTTGDGTPTPYDTTGFTDALSSLEGQLSTKSTQVGRLQTYKKNHPGNVAHTFQATTVTKNDDTLAKLAKRYHTTVAQLLRLNPELKGKAGKHIQPKPGQKVLIPHQPPKKKAAAKK